MALIFIKRNGRLLYSFKTESGTMFSTEPDFNTKLFPFILSIGGLSVILGYDFQSLIDNIDRKLQGKDG
jgi:hypothetical protein